MTQGGSFLAGPGESGRRALLDVERRLGALQATIDSLSPAHGDLTGLDDNDHPQYLLNTGGTLTGALSGTNATMSNFYVSGTNGLTAVTGDYGTVQTTGAGTGSWEGYSINGWVTFMANSSTGNFGIYNDVDNEWAIYCD